MKTYENRSQMENQEFSENRRDFLTKVVPLYTRILLAISCTILLSCNQKVEKGFANINGTSIYYEIKGEGVPVILMHGFALDTRYWDNQFDLFSENYNVIRYDLRGFGKI